MMPDLVLASRSSSIQTMMTPYLHELVPDGPPAYPQLQLYWEDRDRSPYLIRVGDQDAGFALVRHHRDTGCNEMAEFYVGPAHRRQGIGRAAAEALFDRHPGRWHLQVLTNNARARAFWREVIPPPIREEPRRAANGRPFILVHFRTGGRSC